MTFYQKVTDFAGTWPAQPALSDRDHDCELWRSLYFYNDQDLNVTLAEEKGDFGDYM